VMMMFSHVAYSPCLGEGHGGYRMASTEKPTVINHTQCAPFNRASIWRVMEQT
jgi:hypothetical protein